LQQPYIFLPAGTEGEGGIAVDLRNPSQIQPLEKRKKSSWEEERRAGISILPKTGGSREGSREENPKKRKKEIVQAPQQYFSGRPAASGWGRKKRASWNLLSSKRGQEHELKKKQTEKS